MYWPGWSLAACSLDGLARPLRLLDGENGARGGLDVAK